MIKIIRVIANLSINEKIGLEISKREDCLNILLNILGLFLEFMESFFCLIYLFE